MNPKLARLAEAHGGAFSRREALESGYTVSQIRDRLKSGRWTPIRRGVYAELADLSERPPWERERTMHRMAIHAAVRSLSAGAVVSHQSALVMHDLPTWGLGLSEVQVTRRDQVTGRARAGIRHHVGRALSDDDILEIDGVSVAAVRQAVVETACISGYEPAVAFVDAALQRGLITASELDGVLDRVRGWPGSGTALAAAAFADGRAESVGESRLRVLIDNAGLPAPELQARFTAASGQVIARVDFLFREQGVVVEFDGRLKYRSNAADVVMREKTREDRLRAAGYLVIRVTWDELDHPERVVRRILRAFDQARRARMADARG